MPRTRVDDGQIGASGVPDGYVFTAESERGRWSPFRGVISINDASGAVQIEAGSGVTVTADGTTITIDANAGGLTPASGNDRYLLNSFAGVVDWASLSELAIVASGDLLAYMPLTASADFAPVEHAHDEYLPVAASADFLAVEASAGFSPVGHTHPEYMAASAGPFLTEDASAGFQPVGNYASADHLHDERYLLIEASAGFASITHNHDDIYMAASAGPFIPLSASASFQPVGGYASASHLHDDRYLQIAASASFASATHDHDGRYMAASAGPFLADSASAGFAPTSHAHPLAQIMQSGASATSIIQWNATAAAWMPVASAHMHFAWDIRQSGAASGQSLVFNGVYWQPGGPYLLTAASAGFLAVGASATFASATHTHTLAQIEESGAASGQVIKWNGSQWVPSDDLYGAGGASGGLTFADTDPRYVNVGGDMMTGDLQVASAALRLYAGSADGDQYVLRTYRDSGESFGIYDDGTMDWLAPDGSTLIGGLAPNGTDGLLVGGFLYVTAPDGDPLHAVNLGYLDGALVGYASAAHNHDERYLQIAASAGFLPAYASAWFEPEGNYASADHDHDGRYLLTGASATFASAVHNHDGRYLFTEASATFASAVHNHDGRYLFTEASATFASATHSHDGRYLFTEASATFASAVHNHDGRYLFTEASATFASAIHNHDGRYLFAEASATFASAVHHHDGRYLFTEASATFASASHDHDGRYLLLGASATFASATHLHALSDLTDSGAASGQVAKWNGDQWVPADDIAGGGGGLTFDDADPRYVEASGDVMTGYLQIASAGLMIYSASASDNIALRVYTGWEPGADPSYGWEMLEDGAMYWFDNVGEMIAFIEPYGSDAITLGPKIICDGEAVSYNEVPNLGQVAEIVGAHASASKVHPLASLKQSGASADQFVAFDGASLTFKPVTLNMYYMAKNITGGGATTDNQVITWSDSASAWRARTPFSKASADVLYQPIGGYASANHTHDDRYLLIGASATFASAVHNHDGRYLLVGASATFASATHTHPLAQVTQSGASANQVVAWSDPASAWIPVTPFSKASADSLYLSSSAAYASASHNHDGRYLFTEASATFASAVHNHDGRYLFTEASATFASATHIHALSQISQSGASSGQVPKWNPEASAWIPADDTSGAGGGISFSDADPRYVNASADTMTGMLEIVPSAGMSLKVWGKTSGTDDARLRGAIQVYASGESNPAIGIMPVSEFSVTPGIRFDVDGDGDGVMLFADSSSTGGLMWVARDDEAVGTAIGRYAGSATIMFSRTGNFLPSWYASLDAASAGVLRLGSSSYKIRDSGNPTHDDDLARKGYVDTLVAGSANHDHDGRYLPGSGGTLTGKLTIQPSTNPTPTALDIYAASGTSAGSIRLFASAAAQANPRFKVIAAPPTANNLGATLAWDDDADGSVNFVMGTNKDGALHLYASAGSGVMLGRYGGSATIGVGYVADASTPDWMIHRVDASIMRLATGDYIRQPNTPAHDEDVTPRSYVNMMASAASGAAMSASPVALQGQIVYPASASPYAVTKAAYLASYPNMKAVRVRVQGGGAGGGGCSGTGTQNGNGACGGAGVYAERVIQLADLPSSFNIIVGSGGAGGAAGNNAGSNGGVSNFADLCIASGGNGGAGMTGTTTSAISIGGRGGTAGVGDFVAQGGDGSNGRVLANVGVSVGQGGASYFGGGARHPGSGGSSGVAATCYGAGGSGAFSTNANLAGGAGGNGVVIVEILN